MNQDSYSKSYADAGVDITAGYRAVELMKAHIARTTTAGVLSGIGGFGGMFELDTKGMERPVLVSGTDGVGTKLKLAFLMDRHDTVGIDCVAMCVNDIICCGARPLFFLDYIACGKNVPERIAQIVSGVAEGCVKAGAALVGGETAEMPGFYPEDEYDLAGFAVGVVDKSKIIDSSAMCEGDVIIALPSSGVHSNGFSLVRKVFALDDKNSDLGKGLEDNISENIESKAISKVAMQSVSAPMAKSASDRKGILDSIGDMLLAPTKIYVKPVLALLDEIDVKGISHITGGGFYENIPRCIPDGLCAYIRQKDVRVLSVFDIIASMGNIPERDMFNTFNMGVGMIVVVSEKDAPRSIEILKAHGEDAYVIGQIKKSPAIDSDKQDTDETAKMSKVVLC